MNQGSMTPATLYLHTQKKEWLASGRLWQGIPAIERSEKGRLFACWYSGGKTEEPGNIILLEKSDDDGATWTDGLLVVAHDDPEIRCFDPALWLDPLGRLWLCWTQSKGYYDGRDGVWVALIRDPDADILTPDAPRRVCDGLMLNKPLVTSKGEWLFPAALWSEDFQKATETHPELAPYTLANLYASTDQGETFAWRGGVDMPSRAFDEHMAVELTDKRLWMLTRTTYGIGQAFSSDDGRTWTGVGPSGHAGPNSRFFIRRLRSGRILMVNHVNPTCTTNPKRWNTRNNLMAFLSDDDGLTWKGGLMLDTRDDISYPDGTQAANGDIYLTYDYSRYDKRQILYCVFTEDDILEGRPVSPRARFRQVISQATGR